MFLYNDPQHKSQRKNLRRNATEAERKIWSRLRNKQIDGLKFYRQYSIGSYILDFYCPTHRLAIEIDGGQHNEDGEQVHDAQRTKYLLEQGIRVMRFWNNDVITNIDGILETILMAITPSSSPLP